MIESIALAMLSSALGYLIQKIDKLDKRLDVIDIRLAQMPKRKGDNQEE